MSRQRAAGTATLYVACHSEHGRSLLEIRDASGELLRLVDTNLHLPLLPDLQGPLHLHRPLHVLADAFEPPCGYSLVAGGWRWPGYNNVSKAGLHVAWLSPWSAARWHCCCRFRGPQANCHSVIVSSASAAGLLAAARGSSPVAAAEVSVRFAILVALSLGLPPLRGSQSNN